jgi:outer membrane protein assembly factor BamB
MRIFRAFKFFLPLHCLAVAGAVFGAAPPTPGESQATWPRFRGPDGSGVYAGSGLPVSCDVAAGKNLAWTTEVPAAGFSSPVVWADRVFLSGGDMTKREVMCFDVASGMLLWQSAVPKAAPAASDDKNEVSDQWDMAASTVATDGRRVYAIFANGELAAFNFDGSAAWSKNLGVPKNQYGHAASLLTSQDRVIVQLDQGEADDHLSKLYAFDGATGAVAWQQARPVGASWATPITATVAGQPLVITLGNPWVIGYAAKDGAEVWRAECLDGEVTPSPVFAGVTLFVISPASKLQSIRPDGKGEVTQTHLGWMGEDGIPDITSPVSNGELVFVVDSSGVVTCYDAKTGRKQWEHDLEDEFRASPSLADGHLYLVSKKGTLVVLDAAREFHELARSSLGEEVSASPAFAPHKIIIRGTKHLICLGGKDGASVIP